MAAEDWFDWATEDEAMWGEAEQVPARVRRPRRDGSTWTTAGGVTMKFAEMEHSHLLNSIAWVERQFRSLQDTFCDGALDINLLYPEHPGLVAEARRRGLIPRGKNQMVTP